MPAIRPDALAEAYRPVTEDEVRELFAKVPEEGHDANAIRLAMMLADFGTTRARVLRRWRETAANKRLMYQLLDASERAGIRPPREG
jgi:ABC-type phosphate/phosphonate transport system substrate-binding protein